MKNAIPAFKGWTLIFLIGLVIGVWACSGIAITSSAKYDPNIEYGRYKTFNWMPKANPGDNLQQAIAVAEVGQLIETEVEKGLEAKGFKKLTDGTPDFYLNYHANVQQKVEPNVVYYTCGGRICGQQTDMNRVREGTLILDIIQPESKEVVWRGTAVGQNIDPSQRKEAIQTAVAQLLKVFPPK